MGSTTIEVVRLSGRNRYNVDAATDEGVPIALRQKERWRARDVLRRDYGPETVDRIIALADEVGRVTVPSTF